MKRNAISLIEILVAVAILGFAMLPIAFSFSSGTRGIQMGFDEFLAHSAALELLEQTASIPFSVLPTGNFNNAAIQDGASIGGTPLLFKISVSKGIERELKIEEIKKNGVIRAKKISVKVTWETSDKKKKQISLKIITANENV
ncbi:MAG: prepilin-type N-terminal cleavage/methylation domain-containing protein [Candidatus Riflebacteria bacterium]|nr:prepilin-type N-terminal cleavage/methylation domain-containing protein [Candidatus Riflebacteria bacterium]